MPRTTSAERSHVLVLLAQCIIFWELIILVAVPSAGASAVLDVYNAGGAAAALRSRRGAKVSPTSDGRGESEDVCAGVDGCTCRDATSLTCSGVAPGDLDAVVLGALRAVEFVEFTDCKQSLLDLDVFANFTSLRWLSVRSCGVRTLSPASEPLPQLRRADFWGNAIADWPSTVAALRCAPHLASLDLSSNYLTSLSDHEHLSPRLRALNVSFNEISSIESVPSVENLDLSSNRLVSLDVVKWPSSLVFLNASLNPLLSSMSLLSSPYVRSVSLSGSALREIPIARSLSLRHLSMRNTSVEVVDFESFDAPVLEELDLSGSRSLSTLLGQLPKNIEVFRLTDSPAIYLPISFFQRPRKLRIVDLRGNPWTCERCFIGWRFLLPSSMQPLMNCSVPLHKDCSIGTGIPPEEKGRRRVVRARVGESAVLSCEAFGQPAPTVEWWLVRPERLIGRYEPGGKATQLLWPRDGAYRIIKGGNLIINDAKGELVERYRCVATNSKGNATAIIRFRLDFSDWYTFELLRSVFWGSVVSSLVICAVSFVFNLLWIASRKTVLWWIHRAERLSRVRNMVEAVEKYRQRQMVNLQEGYHKSIDHIRDNYHQQVHQLRSSYTSQAERFRGYRVAQIESMNQHLDSLRDNYNQQMCRLRDYGSRRVEQMWESYERQVNRVRTFSLQQRLRLMRQYKVKQRYLNKLLEKFSDDPSSTAQPLQHSEATVLGALQEWEEEEAPLSRSSSYYSLPEYVLDESGEAHCPPNRADMAARSFSRHHQAVAVPASDCLPPIPDDGPSTSKDTRQKKWRTSNPGTSMADAIYARRRYSLIDQSGASKDDDVPSTSKTDDDSTITFLLPSAEQ